MNKKKLYISGFIILILTISLIAVIHNQHKNLKQLESNIEIKNNKIISLQKKNNVLMFTTQAYVANEKQLKLFNDSLYRELKKVKGKIITLSHAIIGLKQDTADLKKYINNLKSQMYTPIQTDSNTWKIGWKLDYDYGNNNSDEFIGETIINTYCNDDTIKIIHQKTEMLKRTTTINLVWGQKYTKKGVQVYVKSSHPALNIEHMEGVYVSYPKKRHWFTGFGIGPSLSIGYDFFNNRPGFIGGISLTYNVYQW